jgi:cobalt-precorrin 5A hydrolase
MDDQGRFAISLLSGHLGGANDLARRVALLTGGTAVVTTATDVHGAVAVDEWAKKHDCAIENIGAAKRVSSAVLDGEKVGVAVTEQRQPAPWPATLWLRPRVLVLGVGCKCGTTAETLKTALDDFLEGAGVSPLSLWAIASIDLKKDETGLIELARELGVPFVTYSAAELAATPGRFTPSERVLSVTGVDNVCERAAVRCADGPLLRSKTLYPGVTLALARKPYIE